MHAEYVESERLGREITELCGHLYAATWRLLTLIREFDERGGWELPGLVSCAHWLNFKCGIGIHAAREKVRVARALKELPAISEALRKGELSYSKVRAMTRIADERNEHYLLMIARHGTAFHVERLVAHYRRCKRAEEVNAGNARHARRALDYFYDDDGFLVFKARLPADLGELVVSALDYAIAHDDSIDRACGETKPGAADRQRDNPGVYHAVPNFDARRADGLAAMAEHYLNSPPTSEQPASSSADRYQVVVHVSADALRDVPAGTSPESDSSHFERGGRVPAETSRRLACDGAIVPLLEDNDGQPLSIGRKSRSIPPAIRRALRARDRGCRFPGCINRYRIDGHHIKHWADGGETSLDNLLQLCRHHHRLLHEGGFSCEQHTGGKIVFRDPYGQAIADGHVPETAVDITDETAWFEEYLADVDIDAETCVTRWEGERIDWPLAVGHLFQ
jgi:hypothetical protein